MKTIQFISLAIITFLSFAVTSCNDDNDDENNIYISATNVSVRENIERKIEISGGTGIYSCEVDNNLIATAKVSGQTLIITGNAIGTTYVTIKDEINAPVTITVKVLQQRVLFEITKLESKIELGKNDYYNLITEELQKDFLFPVGTTYELMIKSENSSSEVPNLIKGDILIRYNADDEYLNGTFELYGDQFIISYSSQTYKYVIDANKEHRGISENLTEHYKKKYPEADIIYIYNNQVLKLLSGEL